MKRYWKYIASALAWLVSWTGNSTVLGAEILRPENVDATETVESIEFEIFLGDIGDPLSEPTALDLGLGFPLWLGRLGTSPEKLLPVGGVLHDASEQTSLQPGQSAKFVFRQDGSSEHDRLRHTPQLLQGVRIADITRVGIRSKGATDWELKGYRLVINGQTFAARDDVRQKARTSVDKAQLDLLEARESIDAYAEDRDDLTALEEAGLATSEDLTRLEEINKSIHPFQKRVARLRGIAMGMFPWFVEEGLQLPWREESSAIGSVKVLLTTAPHTNAETYNYLYFGTGGKKYFLYPAANHFSPDRNPQEFVLPLTAGPLGAGDVRGFSLGMLAHDRPYAKAPDRWHPQRLVVEIDGRSVYDSDATVIDRQSLEAIRLVPPAHLDGNGEVVLNEANALECFVWTAGQAQGLDLENGGALKPGEGGIVGFEPEPLAPILDPLPDDFPDVDVAERDPAEPEPQGPAGGPLTGPSEACWPGETPLAPEPWPGFPSDDPNDGVPAFSGSDFPPDEGWNNLPDDNAWGEPGTWPPGENQDASAGADWSGVGFAPGNDWAGGETPGDGIPQDVFDSAPDPEVNPLAWLLFLSWIGDLIDTIQTELGPAPNEPQPIGQPPQIHNVRLIRNPIDTSQYQVFWEYSGDRSQIEQCSVSLWHVKPETGQLLEAVVATQSDIPTELTVSEWLAPAGPVDPTGYLEPVVMIQTTKTEEETKWPLVEVGPALPWLLPGATAANQPRPFEFDHSHASGDSVPLADQQPQEDEPGAWVMEIMPTGTARQLATDGITSNVAQSLTTGFVKWEVDEQLEPGRQYELIGHFGLLEPPTDEAVRCVLRMSVDLTSEGRQKFTEAAPLDVRWSTSDSNPRLFRIPIDSSPLGSEWEGIRAQFRAEYGTDGIGRPRPKHPAVYGLRLVPVDP